MSGLLRKIGRSRLVQLPDGRKQVVDRFEVRSDAGDPANLATVFLQFGTAHPKYTDCLLVQQPSLDFSGDQRVEQDLVRVYEQLDATAETLVGKPRVLRLPDGRIDVLQDSIQLSSARATPQAVGVTPCPVWPLALSGVTGTASNDTLTRTQHGYLAGDVVRFTALTGGAGLSTGVDYYVRDVTASTLKLSATSGGAAIDFTTDITAATLLQKVTLLLAQEDAPDDGALRRISRRYSTTLLSAPEPSLATRVTERYVNFTYPGVLKAFTETLTVGTGDTRKMLDVYKRGPVTVKVKATVTVSYTTDATLGTVTPALWNPTEWATVRAQWVGFGNKPYNQVDTYPGYRSSTGAAQSESATCSAVEPLDLSIFGNPVYGNTTARIKIDGGPASPGGGTYTLDIDMSPEPVFTAADGTKYYRKVQVTATIPTEPTLPV